MSARRFWLGRPEFAVALLLIGSAVAQSQEPVGPTEESGPWVDNLFGGLEPNPLEDRWSLDSMLGTPDWLRIHGEMRTRYEGIRGQYRADPALRDDENLIFTRTHLWAEFDLDPIAGLIEIMDSRQFGARSDSYLDDLAVNPVDILQAHVSYDLGRLGDGRHRIRAGRSTIDHANRRLVARNSFRNTINAFTGVDWFYNSDEGETIHAFWHLPVNRKPSDFQGLRDNAIEFDDQDVRNQFYGFIAGIPTQPEDRLEVYGYRLDEQADSSQRRELNTWGARMLRLPQRGAFDYEIEAVIQFGEVGASGERRDLLAHFHHIWVGYTFDLEWRTRLQFAWDYATGDRNPDSSRTTRFDTLFATRNYELGPTGIFGAVARSNFISPEVRFIVAPTPSVEWRIGHRGLWLAERRDAWTSAGVQDPTGAAGRHVGQLFETQLWWDIVPDRLAYEIGAAYLVGGRFQDDAPNGRGGDTAYFYTFMLLSF